MVTRLLHEMLLFYCMVAFVTGIVIARRDPARLGGSELPVGPGALAPTDG
jgi:hypothetical protein